MKFTKVLGLSLASIAINTDFALAKWPDQSLYRVQEFVVVDQTVTTFNATPECQDQTMSMINSAMSYKINVDVMEHCVLEAVSVLRTLLKEKNEFCALDLMNIATEQLHWFPPAGIDLSHISMAKQFEHLKTIYYSAPILRRGRDWIAYIVRVSAQSSQWHALSTTATQVWSHAESSTPAIHGLCQEIGRVLKTPETIKLLAKLKNEWTKSTPTCKKPQEARTGGKRAAAHAAVDAAANAAAKAPSRVIEFVAPKPGNVPKHNKQQVLAFEQEYSNSTNQTVQVVIKEDESSGVASRRISSWSIMGAVIVVLSGVTLF
ncbi:LANO_0D04126g1_1 [Lachancea nothofagi CBS 11611]|uniref:LANO_0D04126g1_1 n=1 Tax=Lachancea nothofagi CBS 11611 TaxID=1266666 RepID=A0A1G4JFU9_9SACH|nr:LANO_0D04126g1_1 [Lachancea nothofagi CBS 11611]